MNDQWGLLVLCFNKVDELFDMFVGWCGEISDWMDNVIERQFEMLIWCNGGGLWYIYVGIDECNQGLGFGLFYCFW